MTMISQVSNDRFGIRFTDSLNYPTGREDEKTGEWIYGLTMLPKEYICINGKKFKLSDEMMSYMTYQQYNNVQGIVGEVFSIADTIKATEASPQVL